jgi:hypothetical protein
MSTDLSRPHPLFAVPRWAVPLFAALALAGVAAFIAGASGANAPRWWQAYLVNFLFWSGLSFGQVCFVAVLNVTGSRWGRPLKRLSEALGSFIPAAFVLFWVLYIGRNQVFPWILHADPEKSTWLNVPFVFARNGAGILLLGLLSASLIYHSVKSDRLWNRNGGNTRTAKSWAAQKTLSPLVIICFAFILSLVGFDLVMSLDPHWYSTLFGGYFFIGSFYTGIAMLSLLALWVRNVEPFPISLTDRHFHDIGKLLLAFCLFTGYLFYAQFLVIWYANIPEETGYILTRIRLAPWKPLAWTVFIMIFALPFAVFLSRRIKVRRVPMIVLSLIILVGLWLERLILVAPSLWSGATLPLGIPELAVTAGFMGMVGLSVSLFLGRVPALPVSDPLFIEAVADPQERLAP